MTARNPSRSRLARSSRLALAALVPLIFIGVSCGGGSDEGATVRARPVTVLRLASTTPPPGRLIPGVVTPYRQTQIPFEIAGRVERLADVGDDVVGEQTDRAGTIIQEGTIIAQLDTAPFQRALNRAQQSLAAAELELDAQKVQLESVLPARLQSARSRASAAELNASVARDDVTALDSAVRLAQTTLDRNRELLPTGAVSEIAVQQSETELETQKARLAQARTTVTSRDREVDAANASVSELEGAIALQRATNQAQLANIKSLEESVLDAESNLKNCVLRAPFPGRLTELHVGEGSFVQAGTPVATLTMMNPIETILSVSAQMENELVVGTDALVYPMNGNEIDLTRAVRSTLYRKEGVADSSTRTFEVGLIAPNRRRVPRAASSDLPSAPYVLPIFDNPLQIPGRDGLYTLVDAIGGTPEDAWVLRVRDLSQGARSAETLKGVLRAERHPVKLGDTEVKIASFSLVRLIESGSLQPGDLLVPEPTDAHADGFVIDDNRWLLRPGDLVQVAISHGELPPGFYVPVTTIREVNGKTTIFAVTSTDTAQAIEVSVHESSGEMRRVESASLRDDLEIVSDGVHFLRDGDPIVRVGAAE